MAKKKTKLNIVIANNLPKEKKEQVKETEVSTIDVAEVVDNEKENIQEEEEENKPEPEYEAVVDEEWGNARDNRTLTDLKPIRDTRVNLFWACFFIAICAFLLVNLRSCELPSPVNPTPVNNIYTELTKEIRDYVATIKDPNKDEYCQKLIQSFKVAIASREPISKVYDDLNDRNDEILGFNKRRATSYEHEWQTLFGTTGIIDTWLEKNSVVITESTKKDLFTAIIEGLK